MAGVEGREPLVPDPGFAPWGWIAFALAGALEFAVVASLSPEVVAGALVTASLAPRLVVAAAHGAE